MRLTGGELCGRMISAPKGTSTRPTQDRVRESLFAILGDRMTGSNVLDMFAGSGALGLEAISRGAIQCTFVEVSRRTSELIKLNAQKLGIIDRCRILNGDALEASRIWSSSAPFSIAFVDPPYASGVYEEALGMLSASGIMKHLGIVVVEREKNLSLAPSFGNLLLKRSARYGATFIDFYQNDAEV